MVTDEDQIMLVTSGGKVIRLRVSEIRVIGRNTQGVRLIDLEEGERVVSVARLAERDDEAEAREEAAGARGRGRSDTDRAESEPERSGSTSDTRAWLARRRAFVTTVRRASAMAHGHGSRRR